MKYLHLIWAALFRRKTRTILTLVSIIAAFLLFGLLDAVRISFDQAGNSANGAERLQTGSRLSFIQTLPQSLERADRAGAGREGGRLRELVRRRLSGPAQPGLQLRGEPELPRPLSRIRAAAAERKAFDADRTGALVGATLAKKFHWKVGDKIPLQSTIFPEPDGSKNWTFDIVGILHAKDKKPGGSSEQMLLLHWKYFDETTPYNRGRSAGTSTRVADREPGRSRGQGDRCALGQLRPRNARRRPSRRPTPTGSSSSPTSA